MSGTTEDVLKKVEDFLMGMPLATALPGAAENFCSEAFGSNILLAVSGGADSSVLADIIYRLRLKYASLKSCLSGRIGVAHVNFHLRGEDSNRDQEFVSNLAQRYGFEFFTSDFDTLEYASSHKVSVEIAARELRYGWFYELALKEGFNVLMTAHNADDNAETLLLNLVRGTGRQGLGGIRPHRQILHGCNTASGRTADNGKLTETEGTEKLSIVRPLLAIERYEIENYARENNLSWCTDITNSQNDYARNKIRNQVIPVLRQINPSVIRSLSADIIRFRQMNSEIDSLISPKVEGLPECAVECGGDIVGSLRRKFLIFSVRTDKLMATGNLSFYISELFRRYCIPLNMDELDGIADCLLSAAKQTESGGLENGTPATRVFKLKNHIATVERGELRLYSELSGFKAGLPSSAAVPFEIPSCGTYNFGPYKLKLEFADAKMWKKGCGGSCAVDASKIEFPLICRAVQDGDRFSPYGLRGSKKVSDFLNSRKVDLIFKSILPVLAKKDGSIVCLPSLEIDDNYKLTSQSSKLLLISVAIQ